MSPAQKAAFVARMKAARGKKMSSQPMDAEDRADARRGIKQTPAEEKADYGKCPNCGKRAGMVHSC